MLQRIAHAVDLRLKIDLLLQRNTPLLDYRMLDVKQIMDKWVAHQSGERVYSNEIWTAMIFSQWHERWLGR